MTPTPLAEIFVYATLTGGQATRFDYVSSAGEVHIATLLTMLLISSWAIFLFAMFVMWKRK